MGALPYAVNCGFTSLASGVLAQGLKRLARGHALAYSDCASLYRLAMLHVSMLSFCFVPLSSFMVRGWLTAGTPAVIKICLLNSAAGFRLRLVLRKGCHERELIAALFLSAQLPKWMTAQDWNLEYQ
jgi:hypothetical protein